MRFAAAALLALLAVQDATAQALPGIDGNARRPIPLNDPPWRILGRVQTDLGARCTGFLVAPRVVETAAHCLFIRKTGHFTPPGHVHFLLGYRAGTYRAHAHVQRLVIPAGYNPIVPTTTPLDDHALLVLDRSLISESQLLPFVKPTVGMRAALAGYQQDRAEIAVGDTDCAIVSITGKLVAHNCSGTFGVSGAPLIVRAAQGWAIAGVATLAHAGYGGYAIAQ